MKRAQTKMLRFEIKERITKYIIQPKIALKYYCTNSSSVVCVNHHTHFRFMKWTTLITWLYPGLGNDFFQGDHGGFCLQAKGGIKGWIQKLNLAAKAKCS